MQGPFRLILTLLGLLSLPAIAAAQDPSVRVDRSVLNELGPAPRVPGQAVESPQRAQQPRQRAPRRAQRPQRQAPVAAAPRATEQPPAPAPQPLPQPLVAAPPVPAPPVATPAPPPAAPAPVAIAPAPPPRVPPPAQPPPVEARPPAPQAAAPVVPGPVVPGPPPAPPPVALPPAPAPAPVVRQPTPVPAAPIPAAPAVTAGGGAAAALRVAFTVTETELTQASRQRVAAFAAAVPEDEAVRITVNAYAGGDAADPSRARRTSLSRALSVRSALMEAGIRSTRIDVRALGLAAGDGPADRVDILAGTPR